MTKHDTPRQFPAINLYFAHLSDISISITDVLRWSGLAVKTVVGETQFRSDGSHNTEDIADHRIRIAEWCELYSHAIVIHHHSMIIEVAEEIANRQRKGVVVVTGALEEGNTQLSDIRFNLGGAVVALQACLFGVYIVMGGRLFHWHECKRNPITGNFELK
jgi:L-asparaginase/Glu-tRNA(Gln) amidotransferase subunit D